MLDRGVAMIERYTRPEMAAIWSDQSRFSRWLGNRIADVRSQSESRVNAAGAARRIRVNAIFRYRKFRKVEERTRHDMIAFVSVVGESLG